ncbi:hypothetical protein C8R45DRAFT_1218163 [Mycena sanguinolenta]|nr:hypothetical protein C8R45DRAFT_1218163 [Mycena sanguinolenta]
MGALLGGSLIAIGLSAIVGFQVFLYFQIFPKDTLPYKALVAWIWIIDTAHTVAVCITVWEYIGRNSTNPAKLQEIVPKERALGRSYSATIILTLIATLNVNLFYGWRIHKMSKHNWWLTGLICMLCLTRTALGLFTAAQTITLRDWATFNMNFKACKVAAWSISAATDIVISAARYYHLRDLKQGYIPTRELVDVVVIFTINDGLLTCVTIIVVLAFTDHAEELRLDGHIFLASQTWSTQTLYSLRMFPAPVIGPSYATNVAVSALQAKPQKLVSAPAQANGHTLHPSHSIPQHAPAQSPGSQNLAYAIERYTRDTFSAGCFPFCLRG